MPAQTQLAIPLSSGELPFAPFPRTRYQGSKLKLVPWISARLEGLPFRTVLDAFGGSGCISHALKVQGKAVTYNDLLSFNCEIGRALVENDHVRLDAEDVAFLVSRHASRDYDDFVERTFRGVFFLDEENRWIDTVAQNIGELKNPYKKALAFFALFQAALVKRPYNLFHRANLSLRLADVRRTFGNKTTWDTPFVTHFERFAREASRAVVQGSRPCRATCGEALDVPGQYDLVYLDPPYARRPGVGVNYLDYYHFLEGLTDYGAWNEQIDRSRKHLPLRHQRDAWSRGDDLVGAFEQLFERYRRSIIVVSYRSDGVPDELTLTRLLRRVKRDVRLHRAGRYQYALSRNSSSEELLFVAT